jgi:hypothetical protein
VLEIRDLLELFLNSIGHLLIGLLGARARPYTADHHGSKSEIGIFALT